MIKWSEYKTKQKIEKRITKNKSNDKNYKLKAKLKFTSSNHTFEKKETK